MTTFDPYMFPANQSPRRPPMTSAERQRAFRERHPNYNRQYKARVRAQVMAMQAADAAPAQAAPAVVFQPHKQLALPAPVAPLFVIPTLAEVRERAAMAMEGRAPLQ
jgi:hypothetical protein